MFLRSYIKLMIYRDCTWFCVSKSHLSNQVYYSYFMHVCSIVKTITQSCHGRLDALIARGRKPSA